MVVLAQLVRASVCGTEGRGFEPHIPPQVFEKQSEKTAFFVSGCCFLHSLHDDADVIIVTNENFRDFITM